MTQEVLKQMYQLLLTEPHAPTVCAKLEAIAREALAQPEQEPVAWLLTDKNINSLQVDSIQRLINRLKHAHQNAIYFFRTGVQPTNTNAINPRFKQ